jgi:hypothetical protein
MARFCFTCERVRVREFRCRTSAYDLQSALSLRAALLAAADS